MSNRGILFGVAGILIAILVSAGLSILWETQNRNAAIEALRAENMSTKGENVILRNQIIELEQALRRIEAVTYGDRNSQFYKQIEKLKLEERLKDGGLLYSVTQTSGALWSIDQKVSSLEREVSGQSSLFASGGLKSQVSLLQSDVSSLKDEVYGILGSELTASKIDKLEDEVYGILGSGGLKSRVSLLQSDVSSLKNQVYGILGSSGSTSQVSSLERRVSSLEGYVAVLNDEIYGMFGSPMSSSRIDKLESDVRSLRWK